MAVSIVRAAQQSAGVSSRGIGLHLVGESLVWVAVRQSAIALSVETHVARSGVVCGAAMGVMQDWPTASLAAIQPNAVVVSVVGKGTERKSKTAR